MLTLRFLSLEKLGDYQAALAQVNALLVMGDRNVIRTYVNRSFIFHRLRRPVDALADAEEAVRRDPKCILAYRNRGYSYCILKDYERARADLEHVFHLKPALVMNVMALATTYVASGDYQKAIELLHDRISASPKEAGYYHQLGFVHMLRHDYQRAIECNQRVLSMKTSTEIVCRAYNNLGYAYFNLRDLPGARASFEAGLRRNPKHPILLFSLIEIYIIQHIDSLDVPRIQQRLESVIANTPKGARSFYNGVAAYWRGDYASACALLGYAILEEPYAMPAHLWFCLACAAGQHNELALNALEHALELAGRDCIELMPLRLCTVTNPAFYAAHVRSIVEAIPPLSSEPAPLV